MKIHIVQITISRIKLSFTSHQPSWLPIMNVECLERNKAIFKTDHATISTPA